MTFSVQDVIHYDLICYEEGPPVSDDVLFFLDLHEIQIILDN